MKNLIAYSLLLFLFSMCSIQDSGTADNGDDCSGAESVIIPSWTLAKTFNLPPLQDTVSEPDETVFIEIDTVENCVEESDQYILLTIIDDDSIPSLEFSSTK